METDVSHHDVVVIEQTRLMKSESTTGKTLLQEGQTTEIPSVIPQVIL